MSPTKSIQSQDPHQLRPQGWAPGLFLLSAGTMLYEVTLTRLFSVAQFYHFAFMIISLAMLGFGASGTMLALFPKLGRRRPQTTLFTLALAYSLASVGAYLLTNCLPFDSFSIAWDRRQIWILALHYLALSLPFLCSGAVLGLLFVAHPQRAGLLYATNLAGSAAGSLLALFLPLWRGAEGSVFFSGLLGGLAALGFSHGRDLRQRLTQVSLSTPLIAACLAALLGFPAWLQVRTSPYKGLSYALQYPGAEVVFRHWNGFSRIDLVESQGIRSLPGLSYTYLELPPPQRGLFVDGDDMSAVLALPADVPAETDALRFTGYLPSAAAYQLRPGGQALVLEPRGGLELWVALSQGATRVTAVEANPLISAAGGSIYRHPQVTTVLEDPRSFVRRATERYDVVSLPLTAPYRPIRSGAYSLAEDYHYTVEAFRDYLARLNPQGILVVTRWLQVPPSESLRTFALVLTALEQRGGDPSQQIVGFRGYANLTLLVKREPFTAAELTAVRQFAAARAFDLVYAPDIHPQEVNQYNVLPAPIYYQTFVDLLHSDDRASWYAAYPLDVAPPGDDHPFFGHYFKWSQAGQVIAEMGKTWQPFGGAGYFVLLVLLILALVAAAAIILLPLVAFRGKRFSAPSTGARAPSRPATLAYFGLLGLGYLLVEIPLVQRFILFLGHPAYALTTVLFTLLLFSGLGSALSPRLPLRLALGVLILLVLVYPLLLPPLLNVALGLPLTGRILLTVFVLAPAGLLMGIPFPRGLAWLEPRAPHLVPWAWGVNGAASVVSSVLAALLALTFGFNWVLVAGALCYTGAWAAFTYGRGSGS